MTTTLSKTQAGSSATTVETIVDAADFAALRQEWNELLQSSDSDCLFLTWEWLYMWWSHLAEDRHLQILEVRVEGQLVALAPCCLRPSRLLRWRPLPVLEFLGSGSVGSDYLDVIVRRGRETEARLALASHLAAKQLMIDWKQLKRSGNLAVGVASDLAANGWSTAESVTNKCPFIPLAGRSWESYLATLSAEHRYNFHRKWKRLNRDFAVQFDRVRTRQDSRESVGMLIALHNLRWNGRGGSDAFDTSALVEFHRQLSALALDRDWLQFYVLRLDGRPAAFLYGFLYRRTFYFYQSAFDATFEKYSVGLVTMGLAIKSAIEAGAEEYDLLHGNEAYKAHWSHDSRELARLEMYPPGSVGWICRSSVGLERASRKFARCVLPKGLLP